VRWESRKPTPPPHAPLRTHPAPRHGLRHSPAAPPHSTPASAHHPAAVPQRSPPHSAPKAPAGRPGNPPASPGAGSETSGSPPGSPRPPLHGRRALCPSPRSHRRTHLFQRALQVGGGNGGGHHLDPSVKLSDLYRKIRKWSREFFMEFYEITVMSRGRRGADRRQEGKWPRSRVPLRQRNGALHGVARSSRRRIARRSAAKPPNFPASVSSVGLRELRGHFLPYFPSFHPRRKTPPASPLRPAPPAHASPRVLARACARRIERASATPSATPCTCRR